MTRHLSPCEIKVLGYLTQGYSNKQIAQDLTVSLETVKNHVSHILTKLDARSRGHAVTIALQSDVLQPSTNPGGSSHTTLAEDYLRGGSLSCFCGGNTWLVVTPGLLKCVQCGQLIKLIHSIGEIIES